MANSWKKRVGIAALMAGGLYAGTALAAPDPLLTAAGNNVDQTIVQLKAAKNEGTHPPFGGHRAKAIHYLKKAKRSIERAKKFAEKHPPGSGNVWKKKHKKKKKKK